MDYMEAQVKLHGTSQKEEKLLLFTFGEVLIGLEYKEQGIRICL